ncbi:hypothetical protein [Methylomonas sp. LWB]|uniref:hypothetical protein n=1 Tax=Methylomonas sp. LWB TaxID=1905845 RepID=UPI00111547BB|nr:hypothetical protein [Methylomonas sp. LWB]
MKKKYLFPFLAVLMTFSNFVNAENTTHRSRQSVKNLVDVDGNEINNVIKDIDTIQRQKYIKLQDSLLSIVENEQLTKAYNLLLQSAFNDLQRYEKLSIEVLNKNDELRKAFSAITPGSELLKLDARARKSYPGFFNQFNSLEIASASEIEATALLEAYRTHIISHPRKVFLTRAESEGPLCRNQEEYSNVYIFDPSPCSKYGDVYITEGMYTRYINDDISLNTILLHEAFHTLNRPDVEHAQTIEGVLSALVFNHLSHDKNGKPITRKDAKLHMRKWLKDQKFRVSELEIDKLVMLNLRENNFMRKKYLAVLSSVLKKDSARLAAAYFLDNYINDEHDTSTLENNLVNIQAEFMNSALELASKPPSIPPEFSVLQGKLINNRNISQLEKEKIELQMEKMMEEAYRPKYNLRPHAVNGKIDNYKEYMAIALDELNNHGNDGEF